MFRAIFSKNGSGRIGWLNRVAEPKKGRGELFRSVERMVRSLVEGLEERRLLSTVSLPGDLSAPAGEIIHVPVMMDDVGGMISSMLEINYDTSVLDLTADDVVLGDLLAEGWTITRNVDDAAGSITVSMFNLMPLEENSGEVLELAFHVAGDAPSGSAMVSVVGGEVDEVAISNLPVSTDIEIVGETPVSLTLPTDLTAGPGDTIRVPITINDATGLMSLDLDIAYDTNLLDLSTSDVLYGSLLSGWSVVSNVNDANGLILLTAYTTTPLSGGAGSLIELVFHVPADAPAGPASVSILGSSLLNDEPIEPINGSIEIMASPILTIDGDRDAEGQDDVIRLALSESDSSMLNVFFGDSETPAESYSLANVTSIVVNGLGGNDVLLIDASNGMPALTGGITFNGGAGQDQLAVENSGSTSITATDEELIFGSTPVNYTEVEGIGWEPGAGAALTLGGSIAVVLDMSAELSSLTLTDSASLSLAAGSNAVLKLGSLTLGDNAKLDLADNDLIVSATAETKQAVLEQISSWIKTARNGGEWDGPGLTTSAAQEITGLSVILNDKGDGTTIMPTFAGQSVSESDILVKYTYNGDVTLDGRVDASDYFLVDKGFLDKASGQRNGDLNFDGKVDASDYFLIDKAFLEAKKLPALSAQSEELVLKAAETDKSEEASILQQLFSVKPLL